MMPGTMNPPAVGANYPVVVQRVAGGIAARATSTTINFAATGAGNLIVVEFVSETNGAAPSTPATFTAWPSGNLANGGNLTTLIFYKVSGGGSTSVVVSHGNNQTAYVMREIAAPLATIDFATPVGGATNSNPDPPQVTPAGGVKDYLAIAGASYPTTNVSAYSAGYSNGIEGADTGTTLIRTASAEKTFTAANDNPAAMTIGASVKNNSYTYAVS